MRIKTALAIIATAWLATGCACKAIAPQLSKNAEQIDRNADFILERVRSGKLPSIEWAESNKKLAAKNKKLAEAGDE